ncbi:MAG: hypothetical protein RLY87_2677 [Chloroflexota bacterium]|jgi:hypothetical protein
MIQRFIDTFKDALRRSQGKEALYASFTGAIADMVLTPQEIMALRSDVSTHGLTADDVREVGTRILQDVAVAVKKDGMLSDSEIKTINEIVALTQIAPETVGALMQTLLTQRKLYEISRGVITPIHNTGVQLRPGENAYWSEPVGLYEEKVIRRETVGGSRGVSFRIMRGVSYRIGSSRGQSVPVTATVEVARGDLVITSQRVIFKGDRRTMAFALDDVIGVDPYTNAIVLHVERLKQPAQFRYINTESAELVAQIVAFVLR